MQRTLEEVFPRIEVKNAIFVRHSEGDGIVAWVDCYRQVELDQNKRGVPILVMLDKEGRLTRNRISRDSHEEAIRRAQNLRRAEIRDEMGIMYDEEILDLETIRKFINRLFNKEWMGQAGDGNYIKVDEFAALLGITVEETKDIVKELSEQGLVRVIKNNEIIVALSPDELSEAKD